MCVPVTDLKPVEAILPWVSSVRGMEVSVILSMNTDDLVYHVETPRPFIAPPRLKFTGFYLMHAQVR